MDGRMERDGEMERWKDRRMNEKERRQTGIYFK